MTSQSSREAISAILDVARWAPSGDNAQPWTFRIKNDREVEVRIQRTNPNVYEYRGGEPTLISAGALLENIRIAATAVGLKADWSYGGSVDGIDFISVTFYDDATAVKSSLFDEIKRRSVDRRAFKRLHLLTNEKHLLADTLTPNLQVQWYEDLSHRLKIASLSGLATRIRLTIPETFEVHRRVVDWEGHESERAIPSRALGLDPLTLRLTRWSMASWNRTKFMNTLGAPSFASLQMDLLPGIFCSAYFIMRAKDASTGVDSNIVRLLEAGERIQRFWLTATTFGMVMQPCVAMLAFWTYASLGRKFTSASKAQRAAAALFARAEAIFGKSDDIIFLGRIGWPRSKSRSRSIRRPLSSLLT